MPSSIEASQVILIALGRGNRQEGYVWNILLLALLSGHEAQTSRLIGICVADRISHRVGVIGCHINAPNTR